MKGIVFTEFLGMVEAAFSADVADDVVEAQPLASGGAYTAVGTYGSGEMTALVRALAARVDRPVPDLYQAYGRYLFLRFVELYPQLLSQHDDALDFLAEIEMVVHSEVRKLYPDAELPQFDVTRPSPDRLEMVYRSPRHLADLAEGLLHGAAGHFPGTTLVTREDLADDGSAARFTLTRVGR